MFETKRAFEEKIVKLYTEGALDVMLDLKLKPTNELIRQITSLLATGKIENYRLYRGIRHPIKDLEPTKHEERICLVMVASNFKIDEIINELAKLGEVEISRVQSGYLLFQDWASGSTYILREESEP